ncbi:hypothetical protein PR202_ga07663 [Eleusine coracana subsp. coracana]|uniref:Uncharacterized protein n=1 Tax=Eleusine coracana subsp. coracana TaxID=191504 RepID=A0AAV5BZ23_ELECO|nr:hypothetical protein PR202_ga07663 [Eleusine coracana subsp. coracana]
MVTVVVLLATATSTFGDKEVTRYLMLGGYLGWFGVVDRIIGRRLIDPARTPLLAAWEDRFRAADAVKGVVPEDVDRMLVFLEKLRTLGPYKPE